MKNFLTPEECEKIILHLDECIAMFEREPAPLDESEHRLKTLLSIARDEIIRGQQDGSSSVPFEAP
jgi:hypothetical protein